jgi:hypothetical protein
LHGHNLTCNNFSCSQKKKKFAPASRSEAEAHLVHCKHVNTNPRRVLNAMQQGCPQVKTDPGESEKVSPL